MTTILQRFSDSAPAGDAQFAQFALERVGATGADVETLRGIGRVVDTEKNRHVDICAPILDGSLPDGLSVAKYVTQVNSEIDHAAEGSYQAVLDKLSASVRATLLQDINNEATRVVSIYADHLGMASEDADLYKALMTARCRGRQSADSSTRDVSPRRPSATPQAQH
jgi:hypothetical protein